jgi:hypothetical protein
MSQHDMHWEINVLVLEIGSVTTVVIATTSSSRTSQGITVLEDHYKKSSLADLLQQPAVDNIGWSPVIDMIFALLIAARASHNLVHVHVFTPY